METIIDIMVIGLLLIFAFGFFTVYRENDKEKKEKAKENQHYLEQERKYHELAKRREENRLAEYQEKKEKYLSKVESDKVTFNKHLVLIRTMFEKLDQEDKDFLADLINRSSSSMRAYDVVLNVGTIFAEYSNQHHKLESWIMTLRKLANKAAIDIEDEGLIRYLPIDGAFNVHQTIRLVIDKQLYLTVQFSY